MSKLILPPKRPKMWVPSTIAAPPEPNVFTEERVNLELATFSELFFIKWVPTAYYSERYQRFEGRYALACRWTEDDKRRAWVLEGKTSPDDAFDIWGWFTEDMHDASTVPQDPEAMLAKIQELVGKADNERFPQRQRMAQIAEHNLQQRRKNITVNSDEVEDFASTHYYHTSRATRSFGGLKEELQNGTVSNGS